MNDRIIVSGETYSGNVSIQGKTHYGRIGISGGGSPQHEKYDGPYEAEALLEEDQTFPTEGKVMRQDMVFHGMPVRIVHNPAGGLTYSIGS